MSTIHFSIVTPVKNGSIYIASYLHTLLSQTYVNWQAIIVDDGSTDDTYQVLAALTASDSRFLLLKNNSDLPKCGPSKARNMALGFADGDYVCFLDIDDLWHHEKLATYAAIIEHKPAISLIYSAYVRVREGANRGSIRHPSIFWPPQLWVACLNPIPMLTACVRRSLIADLSFSSHHHEDFLFWHAVLRRLRPASVYISPSVLALYRIHSQSLSANKFKVVVWLYRCYQHLGYSPVQCFFALIARGLIQILLLLLETFSPSPEISMFYFEFGSCPE